MSRGTLFFLAVVLSSCIAVGQINDLRLAEVEVCNSNSLPLNIDLEVIPSFDLFPMVNKHVVIDPGNCWRLQIRVESVETGRFYVNGKQRFFHLVPDKIVQLNFFSRDSVHFAGLGDWYTSYAKFLPSFSLSKLEQFKAGLIEEVYQYQASKITFVNLFLKLNKGSYRERHRLIDSMRYARFDFNQQRNLELVPYYVFLRSFYYNRYEEFMDKLIPGFAEGSVFEKQHKIDNYYSKEYNSYHGKLNITEYLDSTRQRHDLIPLMIAEEDLEAAFLDRYIYFVAKETALFKPNLFSPQLYHYTVSKIQNIFFRKKLQVFYQENILDKAKQASNPFQKSN